MTLLQMRPASPVCFVTSTWSIILLDVCSASSGEKTNRTPPLKPFLNAPLPRPPANTWAFNTKFSLFKSVAIFLASDGDVATPNLTNWKELLIFSTKIRKRRMNWIFTLELGCLLHSKDYTKCALEHWDYGVVTLLPKSKNTYTMKTQTKRFSKVKKTK